MVKYCGFLICECKVSAFLYRDKTTEAPLCTHAEYAMSSSMKQDNSSTYYWGISFFNFGITLTSVVPGGIFEISMLSARASEAGTLTLIGGIRKTLVILLIALLIVCMTAIRTSIRDRSNIFRSRSTEGKVCFIPGRIPKTNFPLRSNGEAIVSSTGPHLTTSETCKAKNISAVYAEVI